MSIFKFPQIATLTLAWLMASPVVVSVVPTSVIADPSPAAMASAIDLHNASRDGDANATAQAVTAFTALMADDGDTAHTVAYLGSSYALTARDAKSVVDKIRYTNRGLRFLDQAVTIAPNDFSVRIIRASVTSNLPAMFGRGDSTVVDFIALDRMFTSTNAPSMAPAMIGVYAQLAELAPDQGDWASKRDVARSMAAGN